MCTREIVSTAVNAADLTSPYNEIAKYIQRNKTWTLEQLIEDVDYYVVERCMSVADNVNGMPADWPKMLHNSAVRFDVGSALISRGEKLVRGESVDSAEIIQSAYKLEGSARMVVEASEITPGIAPFQPTYWPVIDTHIGGIPKAGLTVIGAPPGVGKTSLLIKMAVAAAKNGKRSLLFSMEMTSQQLLHRMLQLDTSITMAERELILIADDIMTPAQVASLSTVIDDDLHFVGIDFAELMLVGDGSSSESIMAQVYLTLARAAKITGTPFVLLSQLSRNYAGGMPEITHLRYTGMAEALSSLILLLYNPSAIFVTQSSGGALPRIKGKGYIIMGKSRYGHKYPGHGRFAIQCDWDGKAGWGNDAGIMKPL
jgi:hypothetical protein